MRSTYDDPGSPVWEKLLVLAACTIAVCLAVAVAKRELFPDKPVAAGDAAVQAGASDLVSDVAGVSATSAPSAQLSSLAPATPPALGRTDCDAMRDDSHLFTRSERQWYIDNCLGPSAWTPRALQQGWTAELQAAGFSLAAPTPSRSALEVDAKPPASLPPMMAIVLATDWIRAHAPVELTIGPADCNAVWVNGHWVVTCVAGLDGCAGPGCLATLSLCVFTSDPVVVPDRFC